LIAAGVIQLAVSKKSPPAALTGRSVSRSFPVAPTWR
jgi:hypothetical protein